MWKPRCISLYWYYICLCNTYNGLSILTFMTLLKIFLHKKRVFFHKNVKISWFLQKALSFSYAKLYIMCINPFYRPIEQSLKFHEFSKFQHFLNPTLFLWPTIKKICAKYSFVKSWNQKLHKITFPKTYRNAVWHAYGCPLGSGPYL